MGNRPFPWTGPVNVKRQRAKNTLVGKIQESQEKRSLLPLGTTIRGSVWRHLQPMHPDDVDKLYLWQIGVLLGNHLVDKGPSDPDVVEAQTTLKKRAPVIEGFIEKRKARQQGKKRGKKR